MKRLKIRFKLLLLSSLLLFGGFKNLKNNNTQHKHDFHTSIADVEYNPKSKAFEVILRVFSDDLEDDILRTMGKKIILKIGKDKTPDVALTKYLEKYFILKNKKTNPLIINYVARETNAEATLIYFEMLPKNTTKEMTKEMTKDIFLHNNVMTDLFSDQVNIVNLAYQDKKTTLMFRRGDTEKAVVW